MSLGFCVPKIIKIGLFWTEFTKILGGWRFFVRHSVLFLNVLEKPMSAANNTML